MYKISGDKDTEMVARYAWCHAHGMTMRIMFFMFSASSTSRNCEISDKNSSPPEAIVPDLRHHHASNIDHILISVSPPPTAPRTTMAPTDDFKIKGAASSAAQDQEWQQPQSEEERNLDLEAGQRPTSEPEPGPQSEPEPTLSAAATATAPKIHDEPSGMLYYMSITSGASQWTEPGEPYWIWDNAKQGADLDAGLQQPGEQSRPPVAAAGPAVEEYKGYNPKIHGDYDPNAPYARHHEERSEPEGTEEQARLGVAPGALNQNPYTMAAAFNARTGHFQTGDQSAERHSHYNKSGRQMDAYGHNIDAAANSHGGVSLKEERRNHKISKKELNALREKKKQRKRAKELAFYTS
nr:ww domain-containing protein c2f3.14c [Quercus suber]